MRLPEKRNDGKRPWSLWLMIFFADNGELYNDDDFRQDFLWLLMDSGIQP